MGLANCLEGVDSASILLPVRQYISMKLQKPLFAFLVALLGVKREKKSARAVGETYMTCMTLPKLPLPTTFNKSKSSIFMLRCLFSTKETPILMEPEPN